MLLTIKNYKKLEGTKYNTDYYFKTIIETDRCYTFILETKIRNGGYQHQIDIHRKDRNITYKCIKIPVKSLLKFEP